MAVDGPDARLYGRERESQHLAGLVASARSGGGALVVRGEAGIGKSALLRQARLAAAGHGLLVLSATGTEAEARLPFAGLHQLLRPVLGRADELPDPQRDAVLTAFGMARGAAPDVFLVALAVLNLLGEAAAETGALLLVEDAHWLDPPSADALAFVARRLDADPIVLLAAARDGYADGFGALDQLRVERLDDAAAAALLDARAPGLPAGMRRRLLDESAGNPLALVELPVAARRFEHEPLEPARRPLTARLEEAFAARVPGLPAATQALLLVAAVNDGDALAEAVAAAAAVAGTAVTVDDVTPAVAAHLVDLDGTSIRFLHPLMRSAIRQRAPLARRMAVHAALAAVVGGHADRRVWHRAGACPGPDDDVAAELEAAARHAQDRGAMVIAVAALHRSGQLTVDPARSAARLLRAAELAVELGRHDVVGGLLQEAEARGLSFAQQAQRLWIVASFGDGLRDQKTGPVVLAEVAARVAAAGGPGADRLAMRLLNSGALRSFWSEADPGAGRRVVAVTEALPVAADDPDRLAILAFAAPVERGSAVIDGLRGVAARAGADAQTLRLLGSAAVIIGDFDQAEACCAASIPELRAQGRLGSLTRALAALAWCAAHQAGLGAGVPAAEEAARLALETSQPLFFGIARASAAVLAALGGHPDRAAALAAEAEQRGVAAAVRPVLATVQLARGLNALAEGRHADAYGELCRMHDPGDPSFHAGLRCFALTDLVEAAAHSGHRDAAAQVVAELEVAGRVTSSPALHAGLRYARAVLADDARAEALFREALNAGTSRWPFSRARTQLAYGQWLRRQRRPVESRAPLRAACTTFDALGTAPWAERARQELRAAGETSRIRPATGHDELTPQELQIARLAAGGLTNREIGQALYLSHRTVSTHLHNIFPKLGITARAQLHAIVGDLKGW
ncbi:helix-turn-helix transcriptional regulator [Dactylosporangium aurantiacum]|uniref:Helix-turn-helix transcriptional regulator n=1 Tax=Dactylosporangium aurantiacum TaxID=35754 RepID=A0A9Q9MQ09_9ACTN|nr:AAA family ATPase [Dactylosporangium aurantiacum]MDG6105555.1 AAA family ATPase [Dactylosporangium aurantiacum]UWZ57102.1 helix-turn-helix transcriptional regulator [Dactylosporangium aurantiacum]